MPTVATAEALSREALEEHLEAVMEATPQTAAGATDESGGAPPAAPEASALPLPRWSKQLLSSPGPVQRKRWAAMSPAPQSPLRGLRTSPPSAAGLGGSGMGAASKLGCGPRPSRRLSRKTRGSVCLDLRPDPPPRSSGLGGAAQGRAPPAATSTGDIVDSQDGLFAACFSGSPLAVRVSRRSVGSPSHTDHRRHTPSSPCDRKVTLARMGHTLRPAQMGQRVAVIGDGWGQGSSGYEALVTEADDYTYTVVALSGDSPWSETHVLKSCCVILDEGPPTSVGGGRGWLGRMTRRRARGSGDSCSSALASTAPIPRGCPAAESTQRRSAGGRGCKASRKRQQTSSVPHSAKAASQGEAVKRGRRATG